MLKKGTKYNTGLLFFTVMKLIFLSKIIRFSQLCNAWPTSKLVDKSYRETPTGGE